MIQHGRRPFGSLRTPTNTEVLGAEVSFSAAISACEKAAQGHVALELLDHMREKRIRPDRICHFAVLGMSFCFLSCVFVVALLWGVVYLTVFTGIED